MSWQGDPPSTDTFAAGLASFSFTSVTNASVAVTFPVGRFDAAPVVVSSISGFASSVFFASCTASSASGCTLTVRHYQETATSVTGMTVGWIARAAG